MTGLGRFSLAVFRVECLVFWLVELHHELCEERELVIDEKVVWTHFIAETLCWTVLAPLLSEFLISGSLTCSFLERVGFL